MNTNLSPQTLYNFITGDFEQTWNCIANNQNATNRGNFMFALLATILLEFIARLCLDNKTILHEYASELSKIEPKYFTRISGLSIKTKDFSLPSLNNNIGDELLSMLFDLIRNGQAHQYQQISVELSNKKYLGISLTGAEHGFNLDYFKKQRLSDHLSFSKQSKNIWIKLHPGLFYLDLKKAVERSKLLQKGLKFSHFSRKYKISSSELTKGLHLQVT